MAKQNAAAAAMAASMNRPAAEPEPVAAPPPKPPKKYTKAVVYIAPQAKRRMAEIAFHREIKENDVYLEAIREYLVRLGYDGPL